MKGIVLFSGGLDSTLCLLKLLQDGHEVVPMFVDYNQWPREGEFNSSHRVVSWIEKYPPEVDNWLKRGFKTSSSGSLLHQMAVVQIVLNTFEGRVGSVWGRNIALVGLAAMWAYTNGDDYEFISLGNHEGDVGPDCKPGLFDIDLDVALWNATKGKIRLTLPIRELTIEDIGEELAKFGKELFDLTYSCYWYPPCGYKSLHEDYRCPGCRRKRIAMEAAAERDSGLDQYFRERLYGHPNCKKVTYQSPLAEKVDY